jgi:hypothetical protein
MAIALMAGTTAAADAVLSGKVKSINPDNKTFILIDSMDKDRTVHLGDKLVVNRDGKESKSDLKVGDKVDVCHDNGNFTWTAHYILVQAGASKDCHLILGTVKSYDPAKKALTFTDQVKTDSTYDMGKAIVRFNMEDASINDVRIGDHARIIVDGVSGNGKATLQSVMVARAK